MMAFSLACQIHNKHKAKNVSKILNVENLVVFVNNTPK